jgi:hypothetical protein
VQLAVQGYDLLEAHYNQLNADIADFTQELQVGAGRALLAALWCRRGLQGPAPVEGLAGLRQLCCGGRQANFAQT